MPRELGINPAMMGRQRSSRFFFFATGDGMDASSDAALYPISSLRGIRPASATSCVLFFEPMSFNNVSTGDTVDQVTINFRTGQFKNFLLDLINQLKVGSTVIQLADFDNNITHGNTGTTPRTTQSGGIPKEGSIITGVAITLAS